MPILVQKNYCWIWIVVDRNGKIFLHYEVGSRNTATGRKLWEAIKDKNMIDVMGVLMKSSFQNRYILSKNYTVEGYSSLFRHFLACLRRKSKCYRKSKKMLKYSVLLLMLKWNSELDAILN